MTAEEFLITKGIHGLDTKKRFKEVCEWMTAYAEQEREKAFNEGVKLGKTVWSNITYKNFQEYSQANPLT